jgi:hypothetical protein
MSFLSREFFSPGTLLHCVVLIPAHDPEDQGRMLELETRATVVRVELAGEDGLCITGCRFEEISVKIDGDRAQRQGRSMVHLALLPDPLYP